MDLVVPFPTGLTARQKWELINSIIDVTGFNKIHHRDFEEFKDSLESFPHMCLYTDNTSALSRGDIDMSYNEFCRRYYKMIYLGGE